MFSKFRTMFMLMLALAVSMAACTDDDNPEPEPEPDPGESKVIVKDNITDAATWSKDTVYQLGGRIAVEDGATLTIEAGTIIKGEAGSGANATALLVARGGTLMAEGTAEAPIIFTSVADEIMPEDIAAGNFGSPNLDPDIDGLWGGVIILGEAPISASNDDGDLVEIAIEGIPSTDPNGLYGGNKANDNSGVIKYISIRHGGSNIGAGNEINGLTLGGVGNGTVIENVEVISNQDDGIEWFGGTVNMTNAITWNVNDDGLDADQSWGGTLDNFVVITPQDHNFELDGPEGSMEAGYTFKNGIVIANNGSRSSADLINIDPNTIVHFENVWITSINEGQMVNNDPADSPGVTFDGVYFDVTEEDLADIFPSGNVPAGIFAGQQTDAADISVFGWTWASQYGALDVLSK
ncbi:MAG: hypothetical protein ACLFN2_03750 [Bacteroidales bacterium]